MPKYPNINLVDVDKDTAASALSDIMGRFQDHVPYTTPTGGTKSIGGGQDSHPTPQRKPTVPSLAAQDQENTKSALSNYDKVQGVVGEEDFKKGGVVPQKKGTPLVDQFHASGLFNSAGAGRTDILNRGVPPGGYVIPADVVAGLGEGNTLAGDKIIKRMFNIVPKPTPALATSAKTTPVVTAGGEFFLHPDDLIRKFGNLKRAHSILDKWVVAERAKHIKELKSLPGPKK